MIYAEGARPGGQPQPRLLRQGPLSDYDYIHHPNRLRPSRWCACRTSRRTHNDQESDPANPFHPFPRGVMGEKRSTSRLAASRKSARRVRQGARQFRLRQGLERRGLSRSRSWCVPGFETNNVDHCTRLCQAHPPSQPCSGGPGAGRGYRRRFRPRWMPTSVMRDRRQSDRSTIRSQRPTIKSPAQRGAEAVSLIDGRARRRYRAMPTSTSCLPARQRRHGHC